MYEVTEVFLEKGKNPIQGALVRDNTRCFFEWNGEAAIYYAWTVTDEGWEIVDRQPQTKEHEAELVALHTVIVARRPDFTFNYSQCKWPVNYSQCKWPV